MAVTFFFFSPLKILTRCTCAATIKQLRCALVIGYRLSSASTWRPISVSSLSSTAFFYGCCLGAEALPPSSSPPVSPLPLAPTAPPSLLSSIYRFISHQFSWLTTISPERPESLASRDSILWRAILMLRGGNASLIREKNVRCLVGNCRQGMKLLEIISSVKMKS